MDKKEESALHAVRLESGAHTPLLYLLIPLILGFVLATRFSDNSVSIIWLIVALILCIAATFISAKFPSQKTLYLWGATFCLTATLGSWLYYAHRVPPPPDLSQQPNREADVVIEVDRVFALRSRELRIAGIGELINAPKYAPQLRGQMIYFQCWKENIDAPVGRGGKIRIRGKLEPTPNDPDGFDGYLRQQGCYLKLSQASLKEITAPQPWLYQQFSRINERWQAILKTGADSPRTKQLAGIATAMLLGEKAALTTEQKERYIASGTMHLFAVSGLHVGIVAGLLVAVLAGLRIPRKLRPLIGLLLLMGYVQVTGAAPSAIRAWWMAFFFWTAFGLMRKPQPLSALACSALVVLLFDPRQLWSAGFQLSYTVVTGLLVYGVPLQDWLRQRFEPYRLIIANDLTRAQRFVRWSVNAMFGLLAISFAATLYSAPLSVRYFGVLAPGAFLLNIPLVTLAPLAMTASMLAVVAGWIGWTAATTFANHASWIFIAGMDALGPWLPENARKLTYIGLALARVWLCGGAGYAGRGLASGGPPNACLGALWAASCPHVSRACIWHRVTSD
ncbi:ComEC/Rec2 family competence protein [Cerasicoccus arenae]|uniref:ComEC/Rec2-related protein domain-containing protein n=1 Tax=Cerasicoccus arenae TaxID=424488 RepID=A0A8J3GEH3_9BACT|nr:ComEC/Rec2 family competence protein [Cerasicoccus arenae]MBK1857862.1 ComEC/Rec2 family competence protein [Cerasicoccus arenae]GHC09311.1 hypothetical protein GCM10007047_28130 [Cerasicoccus arenae]